MGYLNGPGLIFLCVMIGFFGWGLITFILWLLSFVHISVG